MNTITNDLRRCEMGLSALDNVMDPEMNLSVVELGLIYQIDFDDSSRIVYVSMTLTTQFCPMGRSISLGVQRALQSVFRGYEIRVNVTFSPHWTVERISDMAKSKLNQ